MDRQETGSSPAKLVPVSTTQTAHVWLLRIMARWLLSALSAAACCSYGHLVASPADGAHLLAPIRWWRTEAARGIAELEAGLAERRPL